MRILLLVAVLGQWAVGQVSGGPVGTPNDRIECKTCITQSWTSVSDPSYNFILPKTIPDNGLYTCKIQAHVLEIVGDRQKSPILTIGLLGAALGVMVGWILGILFPPPKKKEVAQ